MIQMDDTYRVVGAQRRALVVLADFAPTIAVENLGARRSLHGGSSGDDEIVDDESLAIGREENQRGSESVNKKH